MSAKHALAAWARVLFSLWFGCCLGAITLPAQAAGEVQALRSSLAQLQSQRGPALELATARLRLAMALNDEGSPAAYTEAAALAQQALAALDAARRGQSEAAALASYTHGLALWRLKRPQAAVRPMWRGANLIHEVYGAEHENTLLALEQLAELMSSQLAHADAAKVRRVQLDGQLKALGPQALPTRTTALALSSALLGLDRHREALAAVQQVLGDDPLPTQPGPALELYFQLSLNRAEALNTLERSSESQALAQQLFAQCKSAFGPASPYTLRAQALVATGLARQGRLSEALVLQQQALQQLRGTLGEDDLSTLDATNRVANSLQALGRLDEALQQRQALAQRALARYDEGDELTLSIRLGEAQNLMALGRHGEAVSLLEQVAAHLRNRGREGSSLQAVLLNHWADALMLLGQPQKAMLASRQSHHVIAKLYGKGHGAEIGARIQLAHLQALAGQAAQAQVSLSALLKEIASPQHPAHNLRPKALSIQAEALRRLGRKAAAVTALEQALAIEEADGSEDGSLSADLLIDLGELQAAPQAQLASYTRALRAARSSGMPELVWRAHAGLMRAHQALQQSELAALHGKQAVNQVQALRSQIGNLPALVQGSYLNNKRQLYQRLAQLLLTAGRLPEAQQVLGLLKQQEYSDYTHRGGSESGQSSNLALNTAEARWQQQLGAAGDTLVAQARAKAALDAKLRSAELTPAEQQRHRELQAALKAAREAFDGTLREIAAATAGQPQRLGSEVIDSVRAMRSDLKALGHGAVLLHYLLGPDRLWILLTTPEVQLAREVKVTQAELHQHIATLRQALRNPRSDAITPARALHRLLLAPVAADLAAAQAQTLMLSLDGALRYVPFAALHDGQRFAVEQYRLALFTEAARSKIKDRPLPNWSLTGLGLTKAVAGFSALPAVADELSGLSQVLPGETLLDEAFTARRLRALLSEPRPVLHIASHFKFTPGTEADSYLLMGDGGKLTLQQIRQDDLPFEVDLLTLSACETAVGDNARGAEVEGLGALAQKQGAKAVLATLWPVADTSTGLFMREMYRRRSELKLTKAEALRQVQMDFLHGKLRGTAGAERGARAPGSSSPAPVATGYAHPFYWAPFILMGNWL